MSHTPGPWRVVPQRGRFEGNYNVGRAVDVGKGPMLTFVRILGPQELLPPEYAKDALDNARLIAAAPEMHDALRLWLCYEENNPFMTKLNHEDLGAVTREQKRKLPYDYGAELARHFWMYREAKRLATLAIAKAKQ